MLNCDHQLTVIVCLWKTWYRYLLRYYLLLHFIWYPSCKIYHVLYHVSPIPSFSWNNLSKNVCFPSLQTPLVCSITQTNTPCSISLRPRTAWIVAAAVWASQTSHHLEEPLHDWQPLKTVQSFCFLLMLWRQFTVGLSENLLPDWSFTFGSQKCDQKKKMYWAGPFICKLSLIDKLCYGDTVS